MSSKRIAFACLSLLLLSVSPGRAETVASTSKVSAPSRLTLAAEKSFEKGNLQEAVELQEKAVAGDNNDWLGHAALSYYEWQQGNIVKAMDEGQAAVNLAPHNYVALSNLALIKEGLDDAVGATSLYDDARKAAPNNYVPYLGLARCLTRTAHEAEALALMKQMAAKPDGNYEWYYELADTYLRMEKPELVGDLAERAMKLAQSPEQKAASASEALLVDLRTNNISKARALQSEVFDKNPPKENQLYVRAASALLLPSDPAAGRKFLECAIANLHEDHDSEGFYRLGRVFEQKAQESLLEKSNSAEWLNNASTAYQQAIKVSQGKMIPQTQYYMGLAGVLDQQGKLDKMSEVLGEVKKMESFNTLAPFLVAQLNAAARAEKTDATSIAHCPVQLDRVSFRITNLNCGCQVSKVVEAMEKFPGVAFVHVASNIKPYDGTLLLDQSKTKLNDLLAQTTENVAKIYATAKVPVVPEFATLATTPVSSASDAIRIAQVALHGDSTNFVNAFKGVTPVEPVRAVAAVSKSSI